MSGEKKHKPTQKKLADARKEGQVPRSKDVTAWLGIAGAISVLPMVITNVKSLLERVWSTSLPRFAEQGTNQGLGGPIRDLFIGAGIALIPLAIICVVLALVGTAIQGGIVVATKALKPKWDRLNPINGLKQMFSVKTLWEAAKSVIKTAILAGVIWYTIDRLIPAMLAAGTISIRVILDLATQGIIDVIRLTVIVGLIIAVLDYLITRQQMHKKLRMSDQDIKDEYKQAEGDPLLKGAIKSRQIQMSRNRMMSEVSSADVVLVNPTHYAVALRYDAEDSAPVVVAKGQGKLAAKIRERAAKNEVPVVQDKPLTQALYFSCELGDAIPTELYAAVATVLAFVMRLKSQGVTRSGAQTIPGGVPDIPVMRTQTRRGKPTNRQNDSAN